MPRRLPLFQNEDINESRASFDLNICFYFNNPFCGTLERTHDADQRHNQQAAAAAVKLTSTFPTPIFSSISPRALSNMKAEDALNLRVLLRHWSERGTAAALGAPFRKYVPRMRIVEACRSEGGGGG